MRRLVLFRFHAHTELCISRIAALRRLNPGVPVYGFYGGPDEEFPAMQRALGDHLEGMIHIPRKSPHWKWKHSDLAVMQWFREIGRKTEFDVFHLIEWDLLLASSLDQLYGHIPANGVGLTGLRTVKSVENEWKFVALEPFRSEWVALLRWAQRKYRYDQEPYCCYGPGYCLPRAFLEHFAGETLLELGHDELRVPLVAQIGGFPLCETGLCVWSPTEEDPLFNCEAIEIEPELVARELGNPKGRRAFHPCRHRFP